MYLHGGQVVQVEVDEGAGGDVCEGLRRIESMAPNLPLVIMLLPQVWHTLAAVYSNVLTLAVVPAHKVGSSLLPAASELAASVACALPAVHLVRLYLYLRATAPTCRLAFQSSMYEGC